MTYLFKEIDTSFWKVIREIPILDVQFLGFSREHFEEYWTPISVLKTEEVWLIFDDLAALA